MAVSTKAKYFNLFSTKRKCTCTLVLLLMLGLLLFYWPTAMVSFKIHNYLDTEMKINDSDIFFLLRSKIDQTLRFRIGENNSDMEYTTGKNLDDWSTHDAELFVYSAYIDNNVNVKSSGNVSSLKLVSIVNKNYAKKKLNCALKISDKEPIVVSAVIKVLPHAQNRRTSYFGAFIACSYSKTIHPTHVSLSWTNKFSNWTIIQIKEMKIIENTTMIICVRPMFGDSMSLLSVAEFISFYEVNGVNKFVFYNHSAPTYVSTYLNMLSLKNYSIDVLPWTIPFKADTNAIHEYGQIVQIQDCVFRHQYKFKYVINVDLDEFMVPRVHRDLKDFIQQMTVQNPKAGSFIVPNVFFCSEFIPPNLRLSQNGWPLLSTNGIWRENHVWEARKRARTKWIILPERVNIADIHDIIEHVNGYKIVDVATSIIILHHHRGCGTLDKWMRNLKLKSVSENKDLLRYKEDIEHSLAFQVLSDLL